MIYLILRADNQTRLESNSLSSGIAIQDTTVLEHRFLQPRTLRAVLILAGCLTMAQVDFVQTNNLIL